MSVRVSVQPALLAWARERSGVPLDEVVSKFRLSGNGSPGESSPR